MIQILLMICYITSAIIWSIVLVLNKCNSFVKVVGMLTFVLMWAAIFLTLKI